ncbi:putative ubiquitin-like-specific protease 1B isoform X1 [Papaver somniferum]|uniref:putative ubiquitin-like-specific protease 1B isoform X1 n=1 Tax=Papaver somniferum TaxID=3469 RepID=UPI000E6FF6B6|nr:putative ubiquitin-like-specific protease 1B isoform X1 [Papaver somniferum]
MAESDRIVVDFAWKYVQLMQTSFDECQALLERADGEAPSREEIQRCENIVEFCKMEAGSLDIAYKQGKKLLEQSCEIINRFKNIHQQENIDGSKKIPKASSGKYVFSNKDEIVTLLSSTEFSLSEKIEKLWRFPSSRDEEILIVMGNAAVTIGGFKTLAPRTWLDDIAISAYMILINRRGLRTDGKFHCYCCNSNLYQVYVANNNEITRGVQGFASEEGILNCLKTCFPINIRENHWILAIVNVEEKKISVSGFNADFYEKALLHHGRQSNVKSWPFERTTVPQQNNCYDCGVYVVKYADCYSRGLDLHFTQGDIDNFRTTMAHEIFPAMAP